MTDEDGDGSGESMSSCDCKSLYFVGDLQIKQVFSNNFKQVTLKNILSYCTNFAKKEGGNVHCKLINKTIFGNTAPISNNQERIKGTEKAPPIHTLFHR